MRQRQEFASSSLVYHMWNICALYLSLASAAYKDNRDPGLVMSGRHFEQDEQYAFRTTGVWGSIDGRIPAIQS